MIYNAYINKNIKEYKILDHSILHRYPLPHPGIQCSIISWII